MTRPIRMLACLTLAGLPLPAAAGTITNATDRLTDFSLEELINLEVTSVGKKETKLHRSPAAVAVLTEDDFRRLGANSIPEALRAVPGVQVARISANRWAVSARGLNDEYSNKLLVLMDGRSVYTPLFGGVHWNTPDLVLEDLDRIEVIRGPGATLWGANAVNGVINIISKSAKETQGALVSATAGTEDQPAISARYGATLGTNVYFRVYGKYFNRAGFEDSAGNSMGDEWQLGRGGIRVDWEPGEQHQFTFLGDYHGGVLGEQIGKAAVFPAHSYRNVDVESDLRGGNLLGRWTSRFSEESELSLQVYYDHYQREHAGGGGVLFAAPNEFAPGENHITETRDTWDADLQHRFRLGGRNEVVWGAGFRRTQDKIDTGGAELEWRRERAEDDLLNAFVQDEIDLVADKLALTLGSKFEHNDYTGFEIQPAARLAWTPTERQTAWGSVARAVRNPTRLEHDATVTIGAVPPMGPMQPPIIIKALSNPNANAETVMAYELGYRFEPTRRLTFDLAGFFNQYELLTSVIAEPSFSMDPAPHVVQPYNTVDDVSGYTYGAELLSQWQVTSAWRLTASYTWWRGHFDRDVYHAVTNPEHQFNVRSSLALGRGWELNAAVYYTGSLRALPQGSPNTTPVPSHVRTDVGLNWRASENVEFSLWGQNLLDDGHPEFASFKSPRVAEIPRTFFAKVTVWF